MNSCFSVNSASVKEVKCNYEGNTFGGLNREVEVGIKATARASVFYPLLLENGDRFLHILDYLERSDYKNLRLVCRAGQEVFDSYQKGSPIDKFWDRSLLFNCFDLFNSREKIDFAIKHGMKLSLECVGFDGLKAFFQILEGVGDAFSKYVGAIEHFNIESGGETCHSLEELLKDQKKLMKLIKEKKTSFGGLKELKTFMYGDFPKGSLPGSIECIKLKGVANRIYICGHENLKSIEIDNVHSGGCGCFYLINLPKLESLTIGSLCRSITIPLRNFPELKDVTVHGRKISFDRSVIQYLWIDEDTAYKKDSIE